MMLGESAFRPYYKPASFESQMTTSNSNLYSSPEPAMSSSPPGTTPGGGKAERTRRRRTTFTPEQTAALEREYVTDRYMDSAKRASLAESLCLNEVQVKTWFQNRRAKDKKEGRKDLSSPNPSKSSGASSATPPMALESVSLPPIQESELQKEESVSPRSSSPLEEPVQTQDRILTPPVSLSSAAPAPVPTSYADYLSLGLNPAMSIPTPIPYSTMYELYGGLQHHDYSGFMQGQTAPHQQFFSALSTLDPQNHQPLAQL